MEAFMYVESLARKLRGEMGLRKISWSARSKKKVLVTEPNGQPRHFYAPITTRDLLLQYSQRYCVRDVAGSILSMDAQLEGGNTYLLLPLPRLSTQPGSNSQPCDGARRARPWEPSLDVISENKTLWKSKKEKQTPKRVEKQLVNPVGIKATYTLNQNSWERDRAMSVLHVAPFGFAL